MRAVDMKSGTAGYLLPALSADKVHFSSEFIREAY
jgi:hypothetical protein